MAAWIQKAYEPKTGYVGSFAAMGVPVGRADPAGTKFEPGSLA